METHEEAVARVRMFSEAMQQVHAGTREQWYYEYRYTEDNELFTHWIDEDDERTATIKASKRESVDGPTGRIKCIVVRTEVLDVEIKETQP